jgi:Protein of unknown function (DUF1615)
MTAALPGNAWRTRLRRLADVALIIALAGCANSPTEDTGTPLTPAEARAMITKAIPAAANDRTGWAADIYAAFASLDIPVTPERACAVIAVIEQESSFQADPAVPGLPQIAWREIESRAEAAHVPMLLVRGALQINSPNGRSYAERIDTVKTEAQLSAIFDDFIGMVPLGKTFLANRNPVRTGGPMQVSIAFAETHAEEIPYPYPVPRTIRNEVFSRRGGVYFGVAHLLGYPADYGASIYRVADFNAGHYASRNAAFQNAVSIASGVPLALDGDLLPAADTPLNQPGATERAVRVLAERISLDAGDIRGDLQRGKEPRFSDTRVYTRVFALADRAQQRPVPRAVLPDIALKSPKITRKLSTEWFARRVDERRVRCLSRLTGTNGESKQPAGSAER